MYRRTRKSYGWLTLIMAGAGLLSMIAVVVLGTVQTSKPLSLPVATAETVKDGDPLEDRRLPVAGADGYFVVVRSDGTSYLESPTGKTQLVDKAFALLPDESEIARRVTARMVSQPKRELGQLVVLDTGVVDVPRGAIITFVGKDHLVAIHSDGMALCYRADGSVQPRGRRSSGVKVMPPRKLPEDDVP